MKTRNVATPWIAAVAGFALLTLGIEAKPGKGNDKGGGGGGPPAQAGKGNPGKGEKPDKGNSGRPAQAGGGKKDSGPPAHAGGGKKDSPSAKPNVQNKKAARAQADWDDDRRHRARFVDRDRTRILNYFEGYRDREHGLPPGLAKNLARGKPLPPGWRKKLEPGVVIADDWWDRLVPLSYSLFPEIDPIADTGLYWYGDRVYRVYEPRREIIDVVPVPSIHIDL